MPAERFGYQRTAARDFSLQAHHVDPGHVAGFQPALGQFQTLLCQAHGLAPQDQQLLGVEQFREGCAHFVAQLALAIESFLLGCLEPGFGQLNAGLSFAAQLELLLHREADLLEQIGQFDDPVQSDNRIGSHAGLQQLALSRAGTRGNRQPGRVARPRQTQCLGKIQAQGRGRGI